MGFVNDQCFKMSLRYQIDLCNMSCSNIQKGIAQFMARFQRHQARVHGALSIQGYSQYFDKANSKAAKVKS